MHKKGVNRIMDLKKNKNTFLTFNEFNIKFPGTGIHFLQFLSLINSLPAPYKNQPLISYPKRSAFEFLLPVKKVTKKYYDFMINKPDFFPSRSFERHSRYLPNLHTETFRNSLEIMYTCTRSTKLRDFHFRLLHMTLVTNKEAFHYFKKVPNDRCTFCETHQEDIHHILLYCRFTKNLWSNLHTFIVDKTGVDLLLTDQDRLFGNKLLPFPDLYNHILILTKQYLYACRCLGEKPDFNVLSLKIDREHKIELVSYSGENSDSYSSRKWEPLYPP